MTIRVAIIRKLQTAFKKSIKEFDYQGGHLCVFPMKVNQNRAVIEEYLREGSRYDFGLEAGSKPELLAVIALADNTTPIICNGFKDAEFIEMAMLAQNRASRLPARAEPA